MKPLDPKLLRYAKSSRFFIGFSVITGVLIACLVIAQSIYISKTMTPIISDGKTFHQVLPAFWVLVGIIVLRALIQWLKQSQAHKAASRSIRELRTQVIDTAARQNPRWVAVKGADVVTLVSRGLKDLGPYFVDYLPQLFLSVTVTPIVLVVVLWLDFWSVLVALIAIPLIPIFMILIGRFTQDFSNRRLATMQQLGRQLLDLIAGLPTLKAFGREDGPAKQISKIGSRYTATTMATLRVAFLSGAVLEFLATLSVAMIAVEIGMRLVYGNVTLEVGLIIIMLAPEIYNPIREVGKHFHASADGIAAAQAAFDILEAADTTERSTTCPDLRNATFTINNLSIESRATWAPYNLTNTIEPGKINALVGPSGVGKTTTMMVLLGQLLPTRGHVTINANGNDYDINDINRESLYEHVAWLPQQPVIVPGTVLHNLGVGEDASVEVMDACKHAAALTGFDKVIDELPDGYQTVIGQSGQGLSVGQRQRMALTKALMGSKSVIFMDEPTAHLDAQLEHQVAAAVRELKNQGKTVVVIAHRQQIIELADHRIDVESGPMSSDDIQHYYLDRIEAASSSGDVQMPEFLADLAGGEVQ